MNRVTLTQPDDWHLHLRDGEALRAVLPHTVRRFARAIVMPNLRPPVTTLDAAVAYRHRILSCLPSGALFEPLMTLYLTDNTLPGEVRAAAASGVVRALKYYPAGATTNSDAGVSDIRRCFETLQAMSETGLPLLIHGEVTDPDVDVFDREKVFLECTLGTLVETFPKLKIVLEHITTADAVRFVRDGPSTLAATVTAHHLLLSRNDMFRGGIHPHLYCLPILKRERHRQALVQAATSGDPKFFLGTDSAPHAKHTKEVACGCAGVYTAHAGIELYAEAFNQAGALEKLEAFASFHGADFYGLARNQRKITLEKQPWRVPSEYPFGVHVLVPMRAGNQVEWSFTEVADD
ncbi:MAG: dihydroorotase [Burkholderiales bacterium]